MEHVSTLQWLNVSIKQINITNLANIFFLGERIFIVVL